MIKYYCYTLLLRALHALLLSSRLAYAAQTTAWAQPLLERLGAAQDVRTHGHAHPLDAEIESQEGLGAVGAGRAHACPASCESMRGSIPNRPSARS